MGGAAPLRPPGLLATLVLEVGKHLWGTLCFSRNPQDPWRGLIGFIGALGEQANLGYFVLWGAIRRLLIRFWEACGCPAKA